MLKKVIWIIHTTFLNSAPLERTILINFYAKRQDGSMIILIIVEPLGFFEKDKIFLSLEKTKKRGSFGLQIRL